MSGVAPGPPPQLDVIALAAAEAAVEGDPATHDVVVEVLGLLAANACPGPGAEVRYGPAPGATAGDEGD